MYRSFARQVLILLVALWITGCTTIAPSPAIAPTEAPTETQAETQTEAQNEATPDPATTQASSAEAADCAEGYRFFEHEWLGNDPQCIPIDPQRIVYIPFPSYLYPFGIKPIAAGYLERDARNAPMLADWILSDIKEVDYSAPNLEQVVALQPDLIVHDAGEIDDFVEPLQQIAPLVLFGIDNGSPTLLQERTRFTAAIFGRQEQAEELLAQYNLRVAELKAALEAKLGDLSKIKVSMMRARDEETFDVYPRNRSQAVILDLLGFGRPEAIDYTREEIEKVYNTNNFIRIAKEQVELADGDALIVILSGNADEGGDIAASALATSMKADPIWNSLNAFQQDQVYFVRDSWLIASSIVNAHTILDEIAAMFDVEIPTPHPFGN